MYIALSYLQIASQPPPTLSISLWKFRGQRDLFWELLLRHLKAILRVLGAAFWTCSGGATCLGNCFFKAAEPVLRLAF